MRRLSSLAASVAIINLLLILPMPAWSEVRDDVRLSAITGSIAVHGCEINPRELMVRARPIASTKPRHGIAARNTRSQVVKATASGSPGTYEFRFDRLTPQTPYRLGVKLIGESARRCGNMAWNASRDPLVIGGQDALIFDAYTIGSQIEVWGETGPNRAESGWFGADAFDFTDPAKGVRQIRWRSDNADATGGRLQVSMTRFSMVGERGYNPCLNADTGGIVYEIDFDTVPGEWATIPVDFYTIFGGGRSIGSVDTRTGVGLTNGVVDGISAVISDTDRAALNAGRPIYVRVLPRVSREVICDPDRGGVPPEVILAFVKVTKEDTPAGEPVFAVDRFIYNKPEFDPKRPKAGEVCYRVTKTHPLCPECDPLDSSWDYAIAADAAPKVKIGDTVKAGFEFCVPNAYWGGGGDDGWLESFADGFGSVLTAVVDAAGKLVNFASKAWEDIQNYAVGAVAAGLSEVTGCGSECKQALEIGLEIGLASMGVPPSLPNFDQLVDQGADYMLAQAGSQIGVPDVLTDYASDQAQKFIKKAVKDMKDRHYSVKGLPDWLVPDIRFEPAVLTLELYGTGAPLPSQPGIILANDPIYTGKFVQLPKLLPKQELINIPGVPPFMRPPLRFPVVLDPNMYGLPPAPVKKNEYDAAVWDKEQWLTKRYQFGPLQGCYHLFMLGLSPAGDHIFTLADFAFTTGYPTLPCNWWSAP